MFFVTLSLLTACSGGDDDAQGGLRYTGDIPRFSVDPLEGSGVPAVEEDSMGFVSSWLKPVVDFLGLPKAVAQSARIDCRQELDYWNGSPQVVGRAAGNPGQDYAHSFYAMSIFYDCNAREQAQQDGVGRSEHEDPDDPIAEEIPVLTAKWIDPSLPEDWTRFVSWTDVPESENVSGILINKYLQDDLTRTKTRVDLKVTGGARSVWGVLYVDSFGFDEWYTKFAFREVRQPDGTVDEHLIAGRHWDDRDQTVIVVKAKAVLGTGISVFMWQCPNRTISQINDDCSTGGTATEMFYDEDGQTLDETAAGSVGLEVDHDSSDLLAIGDYFFPTDGGETSEDFFYVNPSPDPYQEGCTVDLSHDPA